MAKARVSDEQFSRSRHRYTDPRTGERLISVTTVVGAFDTTGNKLGAGAGAAVKITKAGGDYNREWAEKRELGSRVHHYASLWVQGRAAEVLTEDEAYMDAFASFCRVEKPEWLETERAVVSAQGYGGLFDGVCAMRDSFWLLDFKTGKHYHRELVLQLSGYAFADGMIGYDGEGWAKALEPMPAIEHCGGLYLAGNGTYELIECPEVNGDSFTAFLGILRAKEWSKGVPA